MYSEEAVKVSVAKEIRKQLRAKLTYVDDNIEDYVINAKDIDAVILQFYPGLKEEPNYENEETENN